MPPNKHGGPIVRDSPVSILQGAVVIALMSFLQPSAASEHADPTYSFARIIQHPDNFTDCRANPAGQFDPAGILSISFYITKKGVPTEITAMDGAPAWAKELGECAIKKLKFAPASRNGVESEQRATLTLHLRASDSAVADEIEVGKIDSLVTAPTLWPRSSVGSCIPLEMRENLSLFVATFTVLPDGSTTRLEMPVGSEPIQEKVVACILDRAVYMPGSRDGVPVEAKATLPIKMLGYAEDFENAAPRTSGDVLEAAYRACFPPDSVTMTSAHFRFDISKNGRVEKPILVKSSGDIRLDEAGICILRMLEFAPAKRNGSPIRSNVTWELPLRPAR